MENSIIFAECTSAPPNTQSTPVHVLWLVYYDVEPLIKRFLTLRILLCSRVIYKPGFTVYLVSHRAMSSEPPPPVVPSPPLETPPGDDADTDESIPYPTLELYRHTVLRGANMGSFLAIIVAPPVLFLRGVRNPAEMLRRVASICAKGMVSQQNQEFVIMLNPITTHKLLTGVKS